MRQPLVDPPSLLHGPYQSPRIFPGEFISCEIRGLLEVKTFTDAPIPQPIKKGRGCAIIVCGDLVKALKSESASAVSYWWGVSAHQVSRWRAALGIETETEGTLALWASHEGNPNIAEFSTAGNAASLAPDARAKRDATHARTMKKRAAKDREHLKKIARKAGRIMREKKAAMTPEQRSALAAIGGRAAASKGEFSIRARTAKRFRTLGNTFRFERLRDRLIIDMRLAEQPIAKIAELLDDSPSSISALLYDLAARYPVLANQLITKGQFRRSQINQKEDTK